MSLVQRAINITVILGATRDNPSPTFSGTNSNTIKITGLRTSVAIVKAGGVSLGTAQVKIYGLSLSVMNQLTTLGIPLIYYVANNRIIIEAGDDQNGMSVVFDGTITMAAPDFDSAPEVALDITAFVGALNAAAPTPPTSFPGPADVATIMAGFATRAGYTFQNNGVSVTLASPYFSGSIQDQIKACAKAAGINYIIDGNALIIWPAGGSRGGLIPLISPDTGLVGYPRYTSKGISLKTLYNPSIGYGSRINVQSSLKPACGEWVVYYLAYNLEAQMPGGAWFTDLEAGVPGYTPIS